MRHDINFFVDEDGMSLECTQRDLDNSDKGYVLKQVKEGFRLMIIRKQMMGIVYIWKRIRK